MGWPLVCIAVGVVVTHSGGPAGDRASETTTKSLQRPHVHNFSRVNFKCDKDIYFLKISQDFDYEDSASSYMRRMNDLMSLLIVIFMGSFFQLKPSIKWGV